MAIEFRPARADELPEFRRLVAYVFAEPSPPREGAEPPMQPEWTSCAFVDGRMAATFAAYPFTMRWNGAPAATAGVTGVGTYPEYRRQGLLRALVERSFAEQRDRGQSLAILWASFGAIYQRFGFGLASTAVSYDLEPRHIAFEDPTPPSGTARLVRAEDALPEMKRVYIEIATPRNLMLHRVPAMWQGHLRQGTGAHHAAVYYAASGEPTGYLLYTTREVPNWGEPAPDQEMEVVDWAALDLDAYRGVFDYLRRHDLVRRAKFWSVPEDDPGYALFLEPRALRRRTGDGIYLRIVDVEQALAARPYAEAGALTLAVLDELCDWNHARFRLDSDGGRATVTRGGRAPDLTLPVRSLSMLASGYRSATELARWGLLEAADPRVLRLADRIFATEYRGYCPDGF